MHISIHSRDVTRVERYDADANVMVTIRIGETSVGLFVNPTQADILFPALQKVYENVQQNEKG